MVLLLTVFVVFAGLVLFVMSTDDGGRLLGDSVLPAGPEELGAAPVALQGGLDVVRAPR